MEKLVKSKVTIVLQNGEEVEYDEIKEDAVSLENSIVNDKKDMIVVHDLKIGAVIINVKACACIEIKEI